MVPQAIGISLHNRIGDSTGDVPGFYLGVFIGTMGLILLTFSWFLSVSVLHVMVCSSIDTPLYWFDPWLAFYHCLLYTRRFLAKSSIYTQLFFKQSRTSSILVSLMLWESIGWVVSVVGSSLGLMFSVGCFFCDQRSHFH